jgi:hypothetical protein
MSVIAHRPSVDVDVSWAVAGSPHASDRATCSFAGQTPASPFAWGLLHKVPAVLGTSPPLGPRPTRSLRLRGRKPVFQHFFECPDSRCWKIRLRPVAAVCGCLPPIRGIQRHAQEACGAQGRGTVCTGSQSSAWYEELGRATGTAGCDICSARAGLAQPLTGGKQPERRRACAAASAAPAFATSASTAAISWSRDST